MILEGVGGNCGLRRRLLAGLDTWLSDGREEGPSEQWSWDERCWADSAFSKQDGSPEVARLEHLFVMRSSPPCQPPLFCFDGLSQKGGRLCWVWPLTSYGCPDAGCALSLVFWLPPGKLGRCSPPGEAVPMAEFSLGLSASAPGLRIPSSSPVWSACTP